MDYPLAIENLKFYYNENIKESLIEKIKKKSKILENISSHFNISFFLDVKNKLYSDIDIIINDSKNYHWMLYDVFKLLKDEKFLEKKQFQVSIIYTDKEKWYNTGNIENINQKLNLIKILLTHDDGNTTFYKIMIDNIKLQHMFFNSGLFSNQYDYFKWITNVFETNNTYYDKKIDLHILLFNNCDKKILWIK